jgi:hypothetical protein
MSYPEDLSKPAELQELLFKKEFAQLKLNQKYLRDLTPYSVNELILEPAFLKENHLSLQSYQQFVGNFQNPETPNTRVLVSHSTGAGKTVTAIHSARAFISYYQLQHNLTEEGGVSNTPLVFIIGFSKGIFQRELLRRPEFGFISKEEIAEHRRLRYLAETGSQADREALSEFESRVKKRLSKKSRGGFFKFYGYKEFFNRLFIFSEEALKNLKKTKMVQEEGEEEQEITMLDEDVILEGLKSGTISLNMELVDSMANGYVICDEIHRVYNSSEINNYGIALRLIGCIYDSPDLVNKIVSLEGKTSTGLDRMTMLRNATLRFLLASATPVNNSPTEIIDLLNILIPISTMVQRYPNAQPSTKKASLLPRLHKEDFFEDNRNLKKGALKEIQNLIQGFVSFLRDNNPKYYPERIIDGTEIPIPTKYLKDRVSFYQGKTLPYLKFVRCPMSPLHYKTYKAVYSGTLPPDGQSLVDGVLPNPGLVEGTEGLGLFRTKDVRYSLSNASQEWKDKNQIDMVKQDNPPLNIITGEFQKLPHLAKYYSKYARMMEDLIENLKTDGGKVLINHQFVKMSGVLFIQEVLRRNGFIDEFSGATDETLCSRCGIARHKHKPKDHEYTPARFIILYGDIDRNSIEKSLEKFKSPDNLYGYQYRVLIGSKIINEGIDLNHIQQEWVLSAPANIPTLIQIFGRGIRKNSHLALPPEKRKVHIRIYVSSLPEGEQKHDLSYEERKYFDKLQDYLVIQEIDRVFNANAIDAPINRDIIMPPHLSAKQSNVEDLGSLYFEPAEVFGKKWHEIAAHKRDVQPGDVSDVTFQAFHAQSEIQTIMYIIKRLFVEQSPVWTYDELWKMVRQPPFDLQVNPALFDEGNFLIALYGLLEDPRRGVDTYQIMTGLHPTTDSLSVSRFFDDMDRRIMAEGRDCRIVELDGYYILFPITETLVNEELEEETDKGVGSKSPPSYLGVNSINLTGIPEIDVDSWHRYSEHSDNTVLRITKHLQTSNISYNQMKYKFFNQFRSTPVENLPTTVEVYDLDFHAKLVEDAIRYAFNILTNPQMAFSELHEFYFKMLYFYDRMELILFADHLEDTSLFNIYKPYVTKANINFGVHDVKKERKVLRENHQYNPFLMSSIVKSSSDRTFNIDRLNEFLGRKVSSKKNPRLEDMVLKVDKPKAGKINKVFSNMLPVGHFLSSTMEQIGTVAVPKIYIPEQDAKGLNPWVRSTEFVQQNTPAGKEVENDIIVGYYEKSTGSIDVKFKLRPPAQKIVKHEDSRMIERGSACNTRKKEDLYAIATQLGLTKGKDAPIKEDSSIKDICQEIKLELMEREMQERRKFKHLTDEQRTKTKRVRWFYLHFEPQIIDL